MEVNCVAKSLSILVVIINMVSSIKMINNINQMKNNALKEFLIVSAYISKFNI